MADVHPDVDKHWPHLGALIRTLNGLGSTSVNSAPATPNQSIAALVDALTIYAQRGGKVPWA